MFYHYYYYYCIFGCNCYFSQHETLTSKTNVLHQIIQLFILLKNACVLFICTYICKIILYKHHYSFLHYSQVFSVGLCKFLLSISTIFCSQVFSYGFKEVFLMQFFQLFVYRLFHRVFQRCFLDNFLKLFTGLFQSQVFSQGPKFWNFLKNLGCAKFTGFFTGCFLVPGYFTYFSQVFI